MQTFDPREISLTKYLFYTGKGGVGKTSVACATAVNLADSGKKILLVSTDPASNLQDVFKTDISGEGTPIQEVLNLIIANLDPMKAAAEYRENVKLLLTAVNSQMSRLRIWKNSFQVRALLKLLHLTNSPSL